MTIDEKVKHEERIAELLERCNHIRNTDDRTIYLRELVRELKVYKATYNHCYVLKHKPKFMER